VERRLVVVGVPGDKRATALERALSKAGREAPIRVSWRDALEDPSSLQTVGRPGDLLRVESPGGDRETWHALARVGGFETSLTPGEWRPGRAWFGGLARALVAFEAAAQHLVPTHPAADVLAMTDKEACDVRLREGGVPMPSVVARPCSVDELRARLKEARIHAVYVKPRWGSSGAGVLAYRWNAHREQLTTTARLVGDRVWNEKRLHAYSDRASIDRLLSLVIADGAVVQRWVPKAGAAGGPFDLRVLVVDGRIEQRVARVGRGTITNLHIDARRLDADQALAMFGQRRVDAVHDACLRAAACFPQHVAIAIDVMVDPRGRPFVLECNAWGDYLPGLTSNGLDSYDVQVRALFRKAS
jgi:hypothetical protein